MQRQLNHYMGTVYRNTKYPNPNQTNPLQMLNPQTQLQQKYFYIQISATQAKKSTQLLQLETDQNKERGENEICFIVKDKKDGIVVEKQLERHFKKKQIGISLSPKNRRIHTQGDFINRQSMHDEPKKFSMKSECSTDNLNRGQGRQTPYLRRKRMSERQVNTESGLGKIKGQYQDNKNSSHSSIYSKKKKSKASQLEFKDIATVKKIEPKDHKQFQQEQISAISKIFQKRALRTFCKTQPNEQSIINQNEKIKSPQSSQGRRHTLNTKRSNEQDPVFNEKYAAQVKLSNSVFVNSKSKLSYHEEYMKANSNFPSNEKGMKLFFFPKHVNKTYKNYYSSHSKKFPSDAEKREKSQNRKGKSSGKNMTTENVSINRTHRNAGYKRIVNTPLKNHQRKAKEQFFNLDGTLQNHRLYPEYHNMKAAHNRPLTAKIQNRKVSTEQNDKNQILNYNQIARKCQSANKSKKKRESTHISHIKPWQMNEEAESQKNLFDLSFSSIHDTFHIGL